VDHSSPLVALFTSSVKDGEDCPHRQRDTRLAQTAGRQNQTTDRPVYIIRSAVIDSILDS
jgi:hypothetical protein